MSIKTKQQLHCVQMAAWSYETVIDLVVFLHMPLLNFMMMADTRQRNSKNDNQKTFPHNVWFCSSWSEFNESCWIQTMNEQFNN